MDDARVQVLSVGLTSWLPRGWRDLAPLGFPAQIELAVLAAVFDGAARDAGIQVTARYMSARPGKKLNDLRDMAGLAPDEIAAMVGPVAAGALAPGGKRRRIEVALTLAAALADAGIASADDFRAAARDDLDGLERTVLSVKNAGKATFRRLAAQVGVDTRPDEKVVDLTRSVLGEPDLTAKEVATLLDAAAERLSARPFVLHYALWHVTSAGE